MLSTSKSRAAFLPSPLPYERCLHATRGSPSPSRPVQVGGEGCLLPVVPSFLECALGHLQRGEDLGEESGGGVGQLLRTFHARQRVDDDLVVDQDDVEQAHAVFQAASAE